LRRARCLRRWLTPPQRVMAEPNPVDLTWLRCLWEGAGADPAPSSLLLRECARLSRLATPWPLAVWFLARHFSAWRCPEGNPLSRRGAFVRSWNLLPGAASPPAMGPHADGLSRLDGLVVSDGIGAQCWFNCFRCCGAAVQSKRLTTWQVTVSVAASLAALLATAVHTAAYLPILLSLGSSHGWSIASLYSRFFARPGSISTWYGLQRSL